MYCHPIYSGRPSTSPFGTRRRISRCHTGGRSIQILSSSPPSLCGACFLVITARTRFGPSLLPIPHRSSSRLLFPRETIVFPLLTTSESVLCEKRKTVHGGSASSQPYNDSSPRLGRRSEVEPTDSSRGDQRVKESALFPCKCSHSTTHTQATMVRKV